MALSSEGKGEMHVKYRAVLQRIADGMTIEEVAEDMKLPYTTVVSRLQTIRIELDTRNTTHAVAIGFRRGILK